MLLLLLLAASLTCHLPPAICHLPRPVICPELIREVESRMNRDYLPPTLKSLSQSPPNAPTFGLPVGVVVAQSHPHSLPLSVVASVGGSNSVPLVVAPQQTAANNRRAYRATHCKLPTVQEGGKFPLTDLLARIIIIIIAPIFASCTTCTNLIISLFLYLPLSLALPLSDNRTLQSRASCLGGFTQPVPGATAGMPIPAKRYRTEKFFGCTQSAAFRKFDQFAG